MSENRRLAQKAKIVSKCRGEELTVGVTESERLVGGAPMGSMTLEMCKKNDPQKRRRGKI